MIINNPQEIAYMIVREVLYLAHYSKSSINVFPNSSTVLLVVAPYEYGS